MAPGTRAALGSATSRRMVNMDRPRIPEEGIVPRGLEIYERLVRPVLGPEDGGKFVVIDVLGGGRAVDDDEDEAFVNASGQAEVEALFYFARVGTDGAAVPAHRIRAF
jgi:hypothetical protein